MKIENKMLGPKINNTTESQSYLGSHHVAVLRKSPNGITGLVDSDDCTPDRLLCGGDCHGKCWGEGDCAGKCYGKY